MKPPAEVQKTLPKPSGSVRGSFIAAKNVSLVPSDITAHPGFHAPQPTSDAGLSPVNGATGIPGLSPYFEEEITPKHPATGIEEDFDWSSASPETKIRAVVEGQMWNMRERSRWIGDFATVFVTGGASRSDGIRGAIADAFKCEVKTLEVTDSAAVGGAILAGTFVG